METKRIIFVMNCKLVFDGPYKYYIFAVDLYTKIIIMGEKQIYLHLHEITLNNLDENSSQQELFRETRNCINDRIIPVVEKNTAQNLFILIDESISQTKIACAIKKFCPRSRVLIDKKIQFINIEPELFIPIIEIIQVAL